MTSETRTYGPGVGCYEGAPEAAARHLHQLGLPPGHRPPRAGMQVPGRQRLETFLPRPVLVTFEEFKDREEVNINQTRKAKKLKLPILRC